MARPIGTTGRPQFHTFTTEKDREEFVAWVRKNYKRNSRLAQWYGDQMFGKAVQPIGNDDGKPLMIAFDPSFNAPTPQTKGDSH